LRPQTIDQLRAPDDYRPGNRSLLIRDEVDKNRFGREVPLSAAARAALDQVCPEVGLLFGSHDYRRLLRVAANEAGIDEYRAARISDYDLRHSRLTHLGQVSSNLSGVMFLAGHKQPATTARYLRPQKQAAAEVLDAAAAADEFRSHSGRKGRSRHSQAKAASPRNTNGSAVVRGRGLEPRWMLSTSTSS
jgi:integrase